MSNLKESSISIDVKPLMAVGVVLSPETPPKVTQLLPSSPLLGKIFVGDHILSVNNEVVKNTPQLIKAVRKAEGKQAVIRLKRDEYCTCKSVKLPSPRPGWESFDIDLQWHKGGMPIGILVYQDSTGNIIVSMVESGSLASSSMKSGDIVMKINDVVVKNKNVAKKMLIDSVNKTNGVKFTIERQLSTPVPASVMGNPQVPAAAPSTMSAVSTTSCTATARVVGMVMRQGSSPNPPKGPISTTAAPSRVAAPTSKVVAKPTRKLPNFDLNLPEDVLAILDAHRDFFKNSHCNPSILKASKTVQTPKEKRINVEMPALLEEQTIVFDPSEKPLKALPKRHDT